MNDLFTQMHCGHFCLTPNPPIPLAPPPATHVSLVSWPFVQPLSLEELLQRRQAEQEAQAKPVFLTKEQRAKLALQKRAEEAAAARERLAEMRQGLVASGLGPTNANGGAAGPTGRDSREARDRCGVLLGTAVLRLRVCSLHYCSTRNPAAKHEDSGLR